MPAHVQEQQIPGQGIIIGRCPDDRTAAIAYFIMGRSETAATDIVKTGDGVKPKS